MREEILRFFQEEVYGRLPSAPSFVCAKVVEENPLFCAGKATLQTVALTARCQTGEVSFPMRYCFPNGKGATKTVVLLNFSPDAPDKYLPAEEVVDCGWAFVSLYYQDVTKDNDDFTDGAAKVLRGEGKSAPGKLAMWAWAAMRAMDYLQTQATVDKKNIAVVGHSRLGKTALLAAALDERFAFVHSNDSGAGGAALFALENANAERVCDLLKKFPYWFCGNFKKYEGKEREMPFDQDALLSLIAPRVLSVGSAKEDLWANPLAERAAAQRASKAWSALGYDEDRVGYYVREGTHYLSREDWARFLRFFDKHLQ